MKFFAIEQHISVIEDVKRQLGELGHTVDVVNFSAHSWAMGKEGVTTWNGLTADDLHTITPEAFHDRFSQQFHEYDGFIACYPPYFARLWQHFDKPVIAYFPVRYEYLCGDSAEKWNHWNGILRDMHSRGKLLLCANNVYDQVYTDQYLGIRPKLITSVCDYVGVSYVGDLKYPLLMETRSEKLDQFILYTMKDAKHVRRLYNRYKWDRIVKHKAFIWIPYTASMMSMFEHYQMNVPIFVPTPELLLKLKYEFGCLRGGIWNECCNYSPGSRISGRDASMPDPNQYDVPQNIRYWMDFYDCFRLPLIQRFNTWAELSDKIHGLDLQRISEDMRQKNTERKAEALRGWRELLSCA